VALYVPAGRRRRNVIIGLVAALVVGLILGGVIGRLSAPSLEDKVASVQDSAREVTARIRSTPNEYEKQLSGSAQFRSGGTVEQSLREARTALRNAVSDAAWLGPSQRTELNAALDPVVQAAQDKVTAVRYQQVVDDAARRIEAGFGIDTRATG
jgi:hypothetical protein